MKNIFLVVLLFSLSLLAQTQQLGSSKVVIGTKTATDKTLEFNINQGAANPKIKANASTQKIQFAQDGVNYKDIGSGSGSGGSGINLLTEGGFESGIAIGWSSTGGTFSAVTSGTNLLYQTTSASFQASSTGQFFESSLITVPEQLGESDCLAKISYKGGDSNLFLTVVNSSNVNITNNITTTLSASTVRRDAKLYFKCPAAATQFKIRVQSTAASALSSFDEAHLGGVDFANVSSISEWQAYTPTFVGLGTVTAINFKWRQVGTNIEVLGTFNNGTVTASTAYFNLPNNYVANLGIGTGVGQYGTQGSLGSGGVLVWNPADNKIYFGQSNWQVLSPGTGLATGGINTVQLSIPIQGLTVGENSINSKCPSDIACENTFSAKVSNAGVVTDENLDWLSTCGGTPPYVCNFNSGIFTTAPNCSVTLGSTGGTESRFNAISSSSITVATFNSAGGTAATDFHLVCRKTGPDFKAKQSIQGFLSSTVTSAANNWRLETLVIGQAAKGIACTASPCGVFNQSGAVSSVTRSGVGGYQIIFPASTFSVVPVCIFSASAGGNINCTEGGGSTTTSINIVCVAASTSAAVDAGINVTCMGAR